MSRRNWNPVSHNTSNGIVRGEFGFISTLIGTDPAVADFFGCGGLTGAAAAAGVSNSSPSVVASITKTANAGEFLVTFTDGFKAVHFMTAEVWGPTAGPNDGYRACIALPANQGSGHTTAITALLTIVDPNTGAPGELDARTVCVQFAMKDLA
jgi:hypothetical protein